MNTLQPPPARSADPRPRCSSALRHRAHIAADRGRRRAAIRSRRTADVRCRPGKGGHGRRGAFNPGALGSRQLSSHCRRARIDGGAAADLRGIKAQGRKSWVGTFTDQPGSIVVITNVQGWSLTGFVYGYGAETWELMPGKGGGHMLLIAWTTAACRRPSPEVVFGRRQQGRLSVRVSWYRRDGSRGPAAHVQDLLVVYTPPAARRTARPTLESMIQNRCGVRPTRPTTTATSTSR